LLLCGKAALIYSARVFRTEQLNPVPIGEANSAQFRSVPVGVPHVVATLRLSWRVAFSPPFEHLLWGHTFAKDVLFQTQSYVYALRLGKRVSAPSSISVRAFPHAFCVKPRRPPQATIKEHGFRGLVHTCSSAFGVTTLGGITPCLPCNTLRCCGDTPWRIHSYASSTVMPITTFQQFIDLVENLPFPSGNLGAFRSWRWRRIWRCRARSPASLRRPPTAAAALSPTAATATTSAR